MSAIVFALLAAVFASATSILVKIGIKDVNPTLATAIRSVVILLMAWGMVFIANLQSGLKGISSNGWLFLCLSGVATGLSWLFGYYALNAGTVSKVVPIDKFSTVITVMLAVILLGEKINLTKVIGCLLLTIGTIFMIV